MKCLSIDLDGTLLTTDHEVSKKSLETIKKAIEQGTYVLLNTGRDLAEVMYYPELKNLQVPIICMNGTKIYSEKYELLFESHITLDTYEKVMNILTRYNLFIETYTNEGIFSEGDASMSFIHEERNVQPLSYQDVLKKEDIVVYKMLIHSLYPDQIEQAQKEVVALDIVNSYFSYHSSIEITGKGTDKGSAIRQFAALTNQSFSSIYSIGDGGNDIDQFKVSDISVAMENGPDFVKDEADFITKSNDDDGVAYAIKHFFKLL